MPTQTDEWIGKRLGLYLPGQATEVFAEWKSHLNNWFSKDTLESRFPGADFALIRIDYTDRVVFEFYIRFEGMGVINSTFNVRHPSFLLNSDSYRFITTRLLGQVADLLDKEPRSTGWKS